MADNFQNALDVQEMEKSVGWLLVKGRIEEEIRSWEAERDRIDITKPPQEVGADYIRCNQAISGLKKVLEIVEDIKAKK